VPRAATCPKAPPLLTAVAARSRGTWDRRNTAHTVGSVGTVGWPLAGPIETARSSAAGHPMIGHLRVVSSGGR
jgi:hypothetical protein